MSSSNDPLFLLQNLTHRSVAKLSSDGATITINSVTVDAASKHTIRHNGKECTYTLASMYLQIIDPERGLVKYRKACEGFGVKDAVKVLDKGTVLGYFLGDKEEEKDERGEELSDRPKDENEGRDETASSKDRDREREREKRRSSKEHRDRSRDKHHRDRDRDRDRRHAKERKHRDRHDKHREKDRHHHKDRDRERDRHEKKKGKDPMTNEQLMAKLDLVVDKRSSIKKAGDDTSEGGERMDDGPTVDVTGTNEAAAEGYEDRKEAASDEGPKEAEEQRRERIAEEERALLKSCLSSEGFGITDEAALEKDKILTRKIMSLEIPVGNSASVLRAGAGGEKVVGGIAAGAGGGIVKRDFAKVLEAYNEVIRAEEKAKKYGASGKRSNHGSGAMGGPDAKRHRNDGSSGPPKKEPAGKPIIVVPNAMTSPITMINAAQFFEKSLFVPRDVAMKKGMRKPSSITFRRKIASRLGGQTVEYEIMDNPISKLKAHEWDRVVAVVAQGAGWQFKGWMYSDPVKLFAKTFGFYIGMEGAPVPKELRGWSVRKGTLNRDKRGLDSVTYASFWNALDEWMAIHKPEYLPSDES